MATELKLKEKTLSKRDFLTTYLMLVSNLSLEKASILAFMIVNNTSEITENVKNEIHKILKVTDNKETYKSQIVSITLGKLVEMNYLKKVKNGKYELWNGGKRLFEFIKDKQNIKLSFQFNIND